MRTCKLHGHRSSQTLIHAEPGQPQTIGFKRLGGVSCAVCTSPTKRQSRPQPEEDEWGEFVFGHAAISRRDAETQRGLLCVDFSRRRYASAGFGFRYCELERLSTNDFGPTEITCAAAGCSLIGLAQNALDTASVRGKRRPLRRKRQYPLGDANGSPKGVGFVRWTTRAEAHATNTEHQFGDGVARKHPSAYANGTWLSSVRRGVPVSWPRSEEDEWGDFARRDAEAQRDSLRVSFSLRLRVSAGASPSQRGLSLGPPSTNSGTPDRKHSSADANGLPRAIERGERHGLKPMLRIPSTSAVTMPRRPLLSGDQSREWLNAGSTCAALRRGVGARRPGRNDARNKSRSLGFSPGTISFSALKSPVFV